MNTFRTFALLGVSALAAACQPANVAPTAPSTPTPITIVVTATPDEATLAAEQAAATEAASLYPGPEQVSMEAVDEYFERGYAVWLSDWNTIWVLVQPTIAPGEIDLSTSPAAPTPAVTGAPTVLRNGGPLFVFDDIYDPAVDAESDPNLNPPPGMQQPKGGIGRVWRENPDLQAALGWALDWEQPYWTLINTYPIGVLGEHDSFVQTDHIRTLYTSDGELFYIHEAGGIWSRP
ncbi:MAG: hypothetical protein ACE5FI_09005 [Anaerolineales bacterium]